MWTIKKTLKERIAALNNGWDKEANRILEEMNFKCDISIPATNGNHYIEIHAWQGSGSGDVETRKILKRIAFNGECHKNMAFKEALLWILEKSKQPRVGEQHLVEINGHRVTVQVI